MKLGIAHPVRRIVLGGIMLVCVGGMIAGFLAGIPHHVPPVLAYACQSANAPCAGGTAYRTTAVDVTHAMAVPTPGAEAQAVEASWAPTAEPQA